jgi:tRNA/rRNA methyltransferase
VIRVVLVRTQGARNAGLAARAVTNFGPAELWFVNPADPKLFASCDYYEMAHGVKNPRTRFPVVMSLEDALVGATESVGFTARMRRHREMEYFDEIAERLGDLATASDDLTALVFGNEADGLREDEAALVRRLVHVRTSPEQPSLNLGVAVSVVLARLFRGAGAKAPSKRHRRLPAEDAQRLIEHLTPALTSLVRGEATRSGLAASIERVFRLAALETRDARLWHRLARAIRGELPPASDPDGN